MMLDEIALLHLRLASIDRVLLLDSIAHVQRADALYQCFDHEASEIKSLRRWWKRRSVDRPLVLAESLKKGFHDGIYSRLGLHAPLLIVDDSDGGSFTSSRPSLTESPRSFLRSTIPTMAMRKQQSMRALRELAINAEPSCTPLHTAVLTGSVDRVTHLLEHKPFLVHAKDHEGNTPLHHACVVGRQPTIAQLLLDHGADVDAANHLGNTPLHKAALGGHMACVELLMAKHANVLRQNHKGQYASDLAGWRMHTDVTRYLRDLDMAAILQIEADEEGNTRLHYAAECNKLDAMLAILQSDSELHNVDGVNHAGYTALHLASRKGHYDIVQVLVGAGANPCFLTRDDAMTAVDLAETHLRIRNNLLRLERNYLADMDRNERGDTSLHVACSIGRLSLVKEFLKADGSDIHCINEDGNTPFHEAVRFGRVDVVLYILNQLPHLNIDLRNHAGLTPVAMAFPNTPLHTLLVDAKQAKLAGSQTNN
ncbi:Aste57867_12666 [Aphanomyces stellatus]|uniref:Aste57867_12666 protein n=1 Tax=Aphanomyces stellatus TaxID=120398 RepID=A0A485KW68_9STRA|nr:hypothetical protein As57867_012620 [Aphanomyces stellatus]VFT89516.1 Aste57867_12666 [Aphanomyces stellatus]